LPILIVKDHQHGKAHSMSKEQPLPQGWVWTTLGEIQLDLSNNIRPGSFPDTFFELYSVPSFDTKKPEILPGSEIGSDKQLVEVGTVLLCKINPRINRAWVVQNHTKFQKIASTEWLTFFPLKSILPEYLCYYLRLNEIRNYLASNASGVGGSLMRINNNTIKTYPFPLPPYAEQERIVAAIRQHFKRLDDVVAALRRAQEQLKKARKATLKYAVEGRLTEAWRAQHPAEETGAQLLKRILDERRARWEAEQLAKMAERGITPRDDSWKKNYKEPVAPKTEELPALPEEWCWATIEQTSHSEPNSITDGPFGSNLKTEHYQSEGARVIRLQNIGDGEFKDDKAFISFPHFESLQKHHIFSGDIVIAALGDNPPRCCIIPDFVGPAIVKADCIRYKVSKYVSNVFVCFSLNSEPVRKRTSIMLHGVGRPRLNLSEIKSIVFPLPPLAEQQQIVMEVERRLAAIARAEERVASALKHAEQLRQSILKQAFAGKLVAQNPQDEPASVLLERIRVERKQRELEEQQRRKELRMNAPKRTKQSRTGRTYTLPAEILIEAQRPLAPDVVFTGTGLNADVIEDVEEFIDEVQLEEEQRELRILRPDDTQVFLEAVEP
jgi:type I restriction enzyme S subunit